MSEPPKGDTTRHSTRIIVGWLILLLVVALLLWRSVRNPGSPGAGSTIAASSITGPRTSPYATKPETSASIMRLDAKDIDPTAARKLVAKSLREIVNAKSYKMVMTSTSLSGNGLIKFCASFTLVHVWSPTRGDLYRCDTLNFSAPTATFSAETMKIIPGTSRTEITNESGNWDMGDGPGREGVAFLLTDKEPPPDTIGMQEAYAKEADEIDSPNDSSTFSAANGTDGDKPVLSITRTQTINGALASGVFELDPATGRLFTTLGSVGGSIRQDFDLSAPIDESGFDVPPSLVATPVKDANAASDYLYEHK